MPVRKGKDKKGTFHRYGKKGKKYRGKGAKSRAKRQGRAIKASQNRRKKK